MPKNKLWTLQDVGRGRREKSRGAEAAYCPAMNKDLGFMNKPEARSPVYRHCELLEDDLRSNQSVGLGRKEQNEWH